MFRPDFPNTGPSHDFQTCRVAHAYRGILQGFWEPRRVPGDASYAGEQCQVDSGMGIRNPPLDSVARMRAFVFKKVTFVFFPQLYVVGSLFLSTHHSLTHSHTSHPAHPTSRSHRCVGNARREEE